MPERVVLATLDFDERGALRGVKAIEQGIGSLQRQTDTTAGAFTQRMFSMRSAAQAFLGGFTLAGAIVGLKNFTTEIAKTDTAFLQFSESVKTANRAVQDFFRPFVHEALLMAANGINAIGSAFGQFFATFKSGYDALGAKGKAAFWTLTALLGGKTGSGFAKSMLGMGGDTRAEAPGDLYGPFGPGYGPQRPDTRYDLEGRPFAPAAQRIDEGVNIKVFDDLSDKTQALTSDTLDLREAWVAMPDALRKFMETGAEIQEATLTPLQQNIRALSEYVSQLSLSFEVVTSAVQGFANALVDAAVTGALSIKKMFGEIIMSIGQAIVAYGVALMAQGLLTYDYGRAAKGAGFVALGAATIGIGSRLASAGGGASSGGGAIAGAAPAAMQGGPTYNISVNVEGRSNPDATGRAVALSIKRALADGAAGGAFA